MQRECKYCGLVTMELLAARRLAAAVDIMVATGVIDARSPAADARVDCGKPWPLEQARRIFANPKSTESEK